MRELKRDEYTMISGGIDTSDMPKVFVNAPPPPNGVYIPSSGTGNGPRGVDSSGGRAGGKNGIVCPPGTSPIIVQGKTTASAPLKLDGLNLPIQVGGYVKIEACRK